MSQLIPCPLCKQRDFTVLHENLPDHLTNEVGQFRLVTCPNCQLIYQNPQLSEAEIQPYYQEDYISYFRGTARTLSKVQWWLLNHGMRRRAQPLLQQRKQGRLLDIGCATGHFLYYMKQYTEWQVYGLEPNAQAAHFAQEEFQLDVRVGYLQDEIFPDHTFDAITMWDVFEHLADPLAALAHMKRLLKPGGIVLLRVPRLPSLDAQLFGRYWIGLDQPRHYLLFSPQTINRMLAQAGYTPVGYGLPTGSFFSFVLSLQFFLFSTIGQNVWTETLIKLLRSIPMRALSAPYFWVVDQLGWGPQLIVVAQANPVTDGTN